jgi:hypothetical protein
MKFKGVYEAQLIHEITGEVLFEERSDNLITDFGYGKLAFGTAPSYLQLYNGTSTGGQDYRRVSSTSSVPGYTCIANEYATSVSYINNNNSVRLTYSFAAPVESREINAFGSGSSTELYSFVALTNPIVQTPETILYLSYTIQAVVSNSSASTGAVSNAWANAMIGSWGRLLGASNNSLGASFVNTTPYFLEDISKAGRAVRIPGGTTTDIDAIFQYAVERSNNGWAQSESLFKVSRTLSSTTSQHYGMHASTIFTMGYRDVVVAANTNAKNPQVKPVVQHGVGDTSSFTNATITPQGQGTLQITGTPVCSVLSKYLDFKITKSGDACDLYQDTVTFDASIDSFTPQTTLLAAWDNEDRGIVKVSFSGGTLPEPLVEGQEYYLIYDAAVLKVAISEADALAGTAINLLDNGTGPTTVTRESTAIFSVATDTVVYPRNHRVRMVPTKKADGTPALIKVEGTTAKLIIAWTVQVGEYVYYSVNAEYQEHPGNSNMLLCKWRIGHLEQPETIASIPASWSTYVKVGDDIVVNTNNGILICDTTTDTLYGPTLIAGVSAYNALAYDEVSQTVACLHNGQGFTLFSVSTFKASGTVEDTVLFSEVPSLNVMTSDAKDVLNTVDFFDKVLTWSTTKRTVVYDWRGVDVRAGVGTNKWVSYSSYTPSPAISRAGAREVFYMVRTGSTAYTLKKVSEVDSYSTEESLYSFNNTNDYIKGFYPFLDGTGVLRWVTSTRRYSYNVSTNEVQVVTRSTSPPVFNMNTVGNMLPKASMGVIDDTPMILGGYWFEPVVDTISIVEGKIGASASPGEHPLQETQYVALSNGLNFQFNNAAGISSENQFIEGERYTALISAMELKTNLDEAVSNFVLYYTDMQKKENTAYIVSGDTLTVTEASEVDFRAIDTVTITKGGVPLNNFSVSATSGIITFTDTSHDAQEVLVTYLVVYRR